MQINVSRHFPIDQLPRAWEWMGQYPLANFDDFGPTTYEQFETEMKRRADSEDLFGIFHNSEPCGFVGAFVLSPQCCMLHGICFDKAVHGLGVAKPAVRAVMDIIFNQGFKKIAASYFADNLRIHRFLQKLGFVEEGYLHRQTMRIGKEIDMRLVGTFRKDQV